MPKYKVGDVIDIAWNKYNHQTRKIKAIQDNKYFFEEGNSDFERAFWEYFKCENIPTVDEISEYNKEYLMNKIKGAINGC